MSEWKTMRVPEEAWEAANEAKGSNETWGSISCVVRMNPEWRCPRMKCEC